MQRLVLPNDHDHLFDRVMCLECVVPAVEDIRQTAYISILDINFVSAELGRIERADHCDAGEHEAVHDLL